MKREINLSPEQVKAILLEAKNHSLRDYLILKTMTVLDRRVGEIVGSAPRLWVPYCQSCDYHFFKEGKCEKCGTARTLNKGEWIRTEPNLPGLLIEDLHDDGIWVKQKGWNRPTHPTPDKLIPMSKEAVSELRGFIGKRQKGRIFEISESRVEQMDHFYAKRAGLIDWKLVHPHRHRHYTTTQIARKYGVAAARDVAGHSNLATTNRYIAETSDEDKRKIIEAQAEIIV